MTKKRYILNFTIILILATVSGYFMGNWYNSNFGRQVQAVTVSEETVRGDDLQKTLRKASGKTPLDLTATENFILAEYYLSQAESVQKHVSGAITAAGVKQTLVSDKIKHDGKIYSNKISVSSFVKVAEQYKHNIGDSVVEVYNGTPLSATEANFPSTPTSTMTTQEYKTTFGSDIDDFISFVVGTKTVINQSAVVKNADGNYEATIDLDTTYAVMNYSYEIKSTAGSSSLPYFKSVKVTFVIDSNWRLLQVKSLESYEVKIAVLGYTGCTGDLLEEYTYDNIVMP